ncbi:hypothetical protein ACB094_02G146600 [Castanea mollissima]
MKPLVILSNFFVVLVVLVDLVGIEVDVEDLLARTRETVRGWGLSLLLSRAVKAERW